MGYVKHLFFYAQLNRSYSCHFIVLSNSFLSYLWALNKKNLAIISQSLIENSENENSEWCPKKFSFWAKWFLVTSGIDFKFIWITHLVCWLAMSSPKSTHKFPSATVIKIDVRFNFHLLHFPKYTHIHFANYLIYLDFTIVMERNHFLKHNFLSIQTNSSWVSRLPNAK